MRKQDVLTPKYTDLTKANVASVIVSRHSKVTEIRVLNITETFGRLNS